MAATSPGSADRDVAKQLGAYATPTLFEAAPTSDGGVAALSPPIGPLYRPIHVFGRAFPVLAAAGDNLALHLAVAEAPAGSVLVVATGPADRWGFWGDILTEAAIARGIRGLVTDGRVRDSRSIRERQFP